MNLQLDLIAVTIITVIGAIFILRHDDYKNCHAEDAQATTNIVLKKGEENAQILADRPDFAALRDRVLDSASY